MSYLVSPHHPHKRIVIFYTFRTRYSRISKITLYFYSHIEYFCKSHLIHSQESFENFIKVDRGSRGCVYIGAPCFHLKMRVSSLSLSLSISPIFFGVSPRAFASPVLVVHWPGERARACVSGKTGNAAAGGVVPRCTLSLSLSLCLRLSPHGDALGAAGA